MTPAQVVVEVALVGEEQDGHAFGTLQAATTVSAMTGHRLLSGTESRLRIAPWRGDASIAHLVPARGRPTPAAVASAVDAAVAKGYEEALTPALSPRDQAPFLAAGFEVHERLLLFVRPLQELPTSESTARLRRGRLGDHTRVLAVDAAAFPAFWRLGRQGLGDALSATPSARLRVVDGPEDTLVGYAVTGRAGSRGYLQRLAVDPDHQGGGLGSALVIDGLRWLRRWGVKQVLVNTQEANEPAVALYRHLGFRLQPEGLAVLRRRVGPASR
jgi:ribosomal protein S18 acetylase RimI-like enzyme